MVNIQQTQKLNKIPIFPINTIKSYWNIREVMMRNKIGGFRWIEDYGERKKMKGYHKGIVVNVALLTTINFFTRRTSCLCDKVY